MSRVCEICGKRPVAGNTVSHSGRKTRRMRVPNIKKVHAMVGGRRAWLNVCTRCIKSGRVKKVA